MKHIHTFESFLNEIIGYDTPYDDPDDIDCESEGYLDANIVFTVSKSVNSDAIDAKEFKSFCKDVDDFLAKYFKKDKALSKLKAVSPINIKESYRDWKDNGDGTFAVGFMSWQVTGDFSEVYASSSASTAEYILPGAKDFQPILKKYKWVDPVVWVEDVESEISNPCDD
jgi:hypothetical protein